MTTEDQKISSGTATETLPQGPSAPISELNNVDVPGLNSESNSPENPPQTIDPESLSNSITAENGTSDENPKPPLPPTPPPSQMQPPSDPGTPDPKAEEPTPEAGEVLAEPAVEEEIIEHVIAQQDLENLDVSRCGKRVGEVIYISPKVLGPEGHVVREANVTIYDSPAGFFPTPQNVVDALVKEKSLKVLAVSFTTKDQPFEKIEQVLTEIAAQNPDAILLHGFMPMYEVQRRGMDTKVVDTILKLFPIQINLYSPVKGPARKEMAQLAKTLNAKVYMIGEIKDEVAEDYQLYAEAGVEIIPVHLDYVAAEE